MDGAFRCPRQMGGPFGVHIYIYIETTDIGVCAIGPLNPLYPLKLRALGARLWTSDISTRPVHSGVRGAGCERPNHP